MHTARVQFLEQRLMVGKQRGVPAVARPTVRSAVRFVVQAVCRNAERFVNHDMVPVDIDDGDADGDSVVGKVVHQVEILLLGIRPVAAPPVAQRPARQNGRFSAEGVECKNGTCIVLFKRKHIPVGFRVFSRFRLAVFSQQDGLAVVVHSDSASGNHARFQFDMRAVVLVDRGVQSQVFAVGIQRTERAKEVAFVVEPRGFAVCKRRRARR
jgi:hypothetical protein